MPNRCAPVQFAAATGTFAENADIYVTGMPALVIGEGKQPIAAPWPGNLQGLFHQRFAILELRRHWGQRTG